VLSRHGERFLSRAFHPLEIAAWRSRAARGDAAAAAAGARYLASRWAAKEALHKALSFGGQPGPRLLFSEVRVATAAARGKSPGDWQMEESMQGVARAVLQMRGVGGAAAAVASSTDEGRAGGDVPHNAPPAFAFNGAAATTLAQLRVGAPLLSISHDGEYALAVCFVQGEGEAPSEQRCVDAVSVV